MKEARRDERWMRAVGIGAAILLASAAGAQESPYTAMADREIKALSPEQTQGYLEGRGMGLALAGELNGYPGPKHVLELARQLGLSNTQRERVQEVFDRMQARAVELGRQIVEQEQQLDHWFAVDQIDERKLAEATEEIGRLNGLLRGAHLQAHLEAKQVLTPHQRTMYAALRGYDDAAHRGHH
jgi:Spy/CpxP family protein refolding chaperone